MSAEAPVENPPETSEEEIVRLATPIAKEEGAAEAAKAIDAKLEFIIIPAATVLSDTPANITSVLSVAEFDRLAGGVEQQLALRFKYDGKIYQTSTYQTATGGELYFYANVSSEGTVTGIIEVRIYQSTDKVMAEANLTELGAGE